MSESVFSILSDDLILNILFKLEDDPRNWARIACVSTKFSSLIRNVCCKTKCLQNIPADVFDLLPTASSSNSSAVLGGWPALYNLAICCPGLVHCGVLENSDLGLQLSEIVDSSANDDNSGPVVSKTYCGLLPCDDLFFDTVYTVSESSSQDRAEMPKSVPRTRDGEKVNPTVDSSLCKRRKICRSRRSHLASAGWNLSREQGNKLLARAFKGDSLYICDWPGCIHIGEKRIYMLFRGIFKNFKHSRVWMVINDGNGSKINLNCAFCNSSQTWDLHSAFCLRRSFGYHDDGEPSIRAYVCENGHVSGAWTDWPLSV